MRTTKEGREKEARLRGAKNLEDDVILEEKGKPNNCSVARKATRKRIIRIESMIKKVTMEEIEVIAQNPI